MYDHKMQPMPDRPADLARFGRLTVGGHESPEIGLCVMEAVALFAGEAHTDRPHCACPLITGAAMRMNDRMSDGERQRLIPYIPRLAGSRASAEVTVRRARLAATWAIKRFAADDLDSRGFPAEAAELRAIPDIIDWKSAELARARACEIADRLPPATQTNCALGDAAVAASWATFDRPHSYTRNGGSHAIVAAGRDWDSALALLDALLAVS